MKPFKLVLMLMSVFFISITFTSLFYIFYIIDEIVEYDVDVEVGNKVGFNLDPDAIHFGTMPAGNKGLRHMRFNNNREIPVRVGLKTGGELRDWLVFSDNNFVLEKGDEKRVNITMYVPKDVSKTKYEGKLVVYIKQKFP